VAFFALVLIRSGALQQAQASPVASPKSPAHGETRRLVSVAYFARPESPTGGIQEAIDALATGGGIVNIPPGEYCLRQSIRVPAGVTLQGAGGSTLLRLAKQAESKLSARADRGGSSARVQDARLFREGDEVATMNPSDSFHWSEITMNTRSLLTLGVLLWTLAPTQADEPSKLTLEKVLPTWDKNQAAR
jgi:hypothetical protein